MGQAMTCNGCHYSFGEPAIIELYRHQAYCPECGAENHNYTKFCQHCQVQMHSDEQIDALYMLVMSRSLRERAYQAELTRQYDVAKELYGYVKEYEKVDTAVHRTHQNHIPSSSVTRGSIASHLAHKGLSVPYYCCFCGARLTIGTTLLEIPNHCPQCGEKLDVIDFEKMIQNRL